MPRFDSLVVSVGYSDYLSFTLPFAKVHFDRLVVVTSPTDIATQKVCAFNHVECVITDVMYRDGAPFNKGAAINVGLKRLDFPEWCVHLDADIVLPPRTREILNLLPLNEQCLYGVDRLMVPSFRDWATFLANPIAQHENGRCFVEGFTLGYRLAFLTERWRGWVPAGYFQLFHRQATALAVEPWYSEECTTAADSDLRFADRWGRARRQLLPELVVYHLDTQPVDNRNIGANWEGRNTPLFAPLAAE